MKKNTINQLFFICVSFLFFLSCTTPTSKHNTYYISSGGNDSNTGTSMVDAWKTIQRANTQTYVYGDSVLFEANRSFAGTFTPQINGQQTEAWFYIGSYGKGKATINAGNETAIFIHNLDSVHIENLIVKGDTCTTNQGKGIYCLNDMPGTRQFSGIVIRNVEASGFRWAGIYVGGVPTDDGHGIKAPQGNRMGYKNVIIEHCKAYSNMYYGIHVTSAYSGKMLDYGNYNIAVSHCDAYNNCGDSTYMDNHSGSGIMIDDTQRGTVSYCSAWNNGYLCDSNAGGPAGIWSHASDSITFSYCQSGDNRSKSGKDGDGYDFDAGMSNSVMEYCLSYYNSGSGFLNYVYPGLDKKWSNNTIRYCISINDVTNNDYASLQIGSDGSPQTNSRYYHNTFITTKASPQYKAGIWSYNSNPKNKNSGNLFANNVIVTAKGFKSMILTDDSATVTTGNVFINLANKAEFQRKRNATISFAQWKQMNMIKGVVSDTLVQSNKIMVDELSVLLEQTKLYNNKFIASLAEIFKYPAADLSAYGIKPTPDAQAGAGVFSLESNGK